MEHLPIILFVVVAVFFGFLPLFRPKPKSTYKPTKKQAKPKSTYKLPKPKVISEYDSEGYNRYGYNESGRNRQGKYNRYYNVRCYKTKSSSEEGFLNIREHPLYLTNHARERMRERMGITENDKMNTLALAAYKFGKSKLQVMKSERDIIEEKEQKYGDSVILIYHGYCYVFTEDNGLKTVYKNDRIRA